MKSLLQILLLFVFAIATFAADVSVTATSVRVSADATVVPGTFGETITAGQVVYQSSTDARYYLADVNVSGKTLIAGIAINGGAAGQPALICTEDPNFTPGFTLVMATPVYVASATAGGIAPSADITTGWFGTVIMVAKTTTTAAFRARGHAAGASS
jgi:hypothetical protein